MVSFVSGITAGIEQTKVAQTKVRPETAKVIDTESGLVTAAALDVQSSNTQQPQAQSQDPEIAAEQVRVSVTTGETNVRGNLTPAKAAELYQQIAKLL